jgi:hypothetical protein
MQSLANYIWRPSNVVLMLGLWGHVAINSGPERLWKTFFKWWTARMTLMTLLGFRWILVPQD